MLALSPVCKSIVESFFGFYGFFRHEPLLLRSLRRPGGVYSQWLRRRPCSGVTSVDDAMINQHHYNINVLMRQDHAHNDNIQSRQRSTSLSVVNIEAQNDTDPFAPTMARQAQPFTLFTFMTAADGYCSVAYPSSATIIKLDRLFWDLPYTRLCRLSSTRVMATLMFSASLVMYCSAWKAVLGYF